MCGLRGIWGEVRRREGDNIFIISCYDFKTGPKDRAEKNIHGKAYMRAIKNVPKWIAAAGITDSYDKTHIRFSGSTKYQTFDKENKEWGLQTEVTNAAIQTGITSIDYASGVLTF